jgi:hypothetical protein
VLVWLASPWSALSAGLARTITRISRFFAFAPCAQRPELVST